MKEITAPELNELQNSGTDVYLLDVREEYEVQVGAIANAVHVPLGNLPLQLEAILEDSAGKTVVVYCRSGMRSLSACGLLKNAGIVECQNLKGGITAWKSLVDPTIQVA